MARERIQALAIPDDLMARCVLFAALDGKDAEVGSSGAFIEGIALGLLLAKQYPEVAQRLALRVWTAVDAEHELSKAGAAQGIGHVATFIATGDRGALADALEIG